MFVFVFVFVFVFIFVFVFVCAVSLLLVTDISSGGKEKKQHHRSVSRFVVHCPPSSGIPIRGSWSGRVAIAAVAFAVSFDPVVVVAVVVVVVFFVIVRYYLRLVCRTEYFPPLFTCRSDLVLLPPPPAGKYCYS